MARKNETSKSYEVLEVLEVEGKPLKDKRVAVTGHLATPRKNVIGLISQAGGEYHDNVKYNTSYLVTNEDWTSSSSTSTKFVKAKQNGTKIISENEFLKLLGF